ncbi:MAG TPA: kelch repeat-containing protein [Chthoniobacterales bacterium]|nr:kelch repeat-containing protein [Chthoniobacterales bacterium]
MLTVRLTPFDPIVLPGGDVLAAGGNGQNADNCELYNPATGKWSITGSLNEGRWLFGAAQLTDGRVLVAGGYPNGHTPDFVPDSELYDPVSGTWSLSGALNRGRAGHVQQLLPDGRVLIAGGLAGDPFDAQPTNTAEIFDPGTGEWALARPMNTPRVAFSGTLLNDGKVLVAGGGNATARLNSIEEYDPATGRWHLLKTTLASPRTDHTTTRLLDGSVLVVGGVDENNELPPDAERFVNPH